MAKNIAIIFAGGIGQRFGSEIPKQFVKIYDREIIIHTLKVFQKHPEIDEIYVGCIKEWIPFLEKLIKENHISKIPTKGIVPGGASGLDTIYRVLKKAREKNTDDDIVLIHDGVRPIVTNREISENIEMANLKGSAITCIPLTDTPIFSECGKVVDSTLARNQIFRGVAPQTFKLGHIIKAHEIIRKEDPDYTGKYSNGIIVDSASLVKAAFDENCSIVKGNPNNMKVTNTQDFFALLGILQCSDVANYFMGQSFDFQLNDAMKYFESIDK